MYTNLNILRFYRVKTSTSNLLKKKAYDMLDYEFSC